MAYVVTLAFSWAFVQQNSMRHWEGKYVRGALRDRDVHRAALEGAMGNLSVKLNPFRRSNDDAASPRGRADSESGARSPPPPAS